MVTKKYIAAAYLRLSVEDGEKQESNSIQNQRNLIADFVEKKPEINLITEMVDDGYSGVNFDRPAFQAMLKEIKSGTINCVIVKDLSRFGRNYIESGKYLERIFPALGVRFISVNDGIDSINQTMEENQMMIPFKNLMNDSYSRDISVKIRSELDMKRRKGEYIGSFAPYGYQKDPLDKNHLIPDLKTALAVKNIFRWHRMGFSADRIAQRLNLRKIPSPLAYQKQNQDMSWDTSICSELSWSAQAVYRILKNEVYLGHMVQGKKEKPNHKIKTYIPKPPDAWFRAENTHEPLIREWEFSLSQKLLSGFRASKGEYFEYPLSGLMVCADCGSSMVHRTSTYKDKHYCYYICSGYKKNKENCHSHIIRRDKVEAGVFSYFGRFLDCFPEIRDGIESSMTLKTDLKKESESLQTQISEVEHLLSSLDLDKEAQILTEEEWIQLKNFYRHRLCSLKDKKKQVENEQQLLEAAAFVSFNGYPKQNRIYLRALAVSMIDKIQVIGKDRIKVCVRFRGDDMGEKNHGLYRYNFKK